VKVETSNSVNKLIVSQVLPHGWQTIPERDVVTGQVTRTIKILMSTMQPDISGTSEARVVKFCAQAGFVKAQHKDVK